MTIDTHRSTPAWIDVLLRDIALLRRQVAELDDSLDAATADDFGHLLDAAGRLEAMAVASGAAANTHDVMNILTAVRGYAEMLREDIGSDYPRLDSLLSSLLAAVHRTHTGSAGHDSHDQRTIQSEPGFILAVDDLQENRELVARNLSRIGHFVITAANGEEALREVA